MIKNNKEASILAPVGELEALCKYPLFNLVTMGGFTVCGDFIFYLGITNNILLIVAVIGIVLGGLAGFVHTAVYMRQINMKKSPISGSSETVALLDL